MIKIMKTETLYRIAADNGISLDFFELPVTKSVCVKHNGKCYIAIDPSQTSTNAAERVCLAHELGHCQTDSFYNIYAPLDNRGKHERKADIWAINKLIPKKELVKAIKKGHREISELAEYFSVTEDFMRKAFEIYSN